MKLAAQCLAGAFLVGIGWLGCSSDPAENGTASTLGAGGSGATGGGATGGSGATGGGVPASGFFERTDLVSDQAGVAEHVDPALVNPWGLAFGPETFFWVANEATATSTLYDGDGGIHNDVLGGPVTVPAAGDESGPTGLVFNASDGFMIGTNGGTKPSVLIFATLGGTLVGWSPDVDLHRGVVAVDNSASGASYTGLAIAKTDIFGTLLYAANFAQGTVDMYDETFAPVYGMGQFLDPTLPAGYAPFGIHAIGAKIYVAYALRGSSGDEEPGAGNGYVSVFDDTGEFIDRVASKGTLDAPWGLTLAPREFGAFGGALLVGNFGDGRITAFDATSFEMLGQLRGETGAPVAIPGLWALAFGNGNMAGEADDLYFTAGPDDETHGIFGEIAPAGGDEGE
jgi:uncharacterized protein (TIGR03118 family)